MLTHHLPTLPQVICQIAGTIVVVLLARLELLALLAILLALFLWYQRWFVIATNEFKRYEAVTRSSVYTMFSSLVKGLSTIRAYRGEERYVEEF